MKYKYLPATLFLFLSTLGAAAQFKLPVNNGFRNDVQKVVAEYPHQFAAIRGEVVVKNPQTIEYASLIKPGSAEEASIVAYSTAGKAIYSWQTVLLTTEDFTEAQKKYKWLFQQLKGMNIKYVADAYTLRGTYEEPDESRKFTTSVLTVQAPPTPLQKLKVEVSMKFEFPEWKVSLLIYEKEREDDEAINPYEQ